ncbi:hypothetical protein BRC62_06965 [Halobacteriales archaeon QH_10_67_13]|nr:MAG: hypothetical protein BRC62_06965 [Halobacteriales archaeon QH_10_67_13]
MTPDRQTELLLWTVAAAAGIGWWVTTQRLFVRQILGVWGLAFVAVVLTGVLVSGLHRNRVWQAWGLVWAVGLGFNLVLFRRTPEALVRDQLVELGYLYPWFLLVGGGYLFTAVYDRGDEALTRLDRRESTRRSRTTGPGSRCPLSRSDGGACGLRSPSVLLSGRYTAVRSRATRASSVPIEFCFSRSL